MKKFKKLLTLIMFVCLTVNQFSLCMQRVSEQDELEQVSKNLIDACKQGNLEKVKEAIKKGANVNYQDIKKINLPNTSKEYTRKENPLNHAMIRYSKIWIDDYIPTRNYCSWISPAVKDNLATKYKIIRHLVENGADVNIPNEDEHTWLHSLAIGALNEGDAPNTHIFDLIELFITHGANLESVDSWGETPYKIAVHRGHEKRAKLLSKPRHKNYPWEKNDTAERKKYCTTDEQEQGLIEKRVLKLYDTSFNVPVWLLLMLS